MKQSFLGVENWKSQIKETFSGFPKRWWRVATVNVLTILSIVFLTILFAVIWIVGIRFDLESIFFSFRQGIIPDEGFIPFLIFIVFWILGIIILGIIGKISNWKIIKSHMEKKEENPFVLYFSKSWTLLGRYILTGILAYWPIFVAGLLFILSIITIFFFFQPLFFQIKNNPSFNPSLFFTTVSSASWGILVGAFFVSFFAVIYSIYRSFQVVFTIPALIHFHHDPSTTVSKGIQMVKGNWWRVFWTIAIFTFILGIISSIFSLPEDLMEKGIIESNVVLTRLLSLVNGIFSLCVVAPLSVTFIYITMLHILKHKKIK